MRHQRALSNMTPQQQLAKHQKLASTSVNVYKPKILQKHYSAVYNGNGSISHRHSQPPDVRRASTADGLTILTDTEDQTSPKPSSNYLPQPPSPQIHPNGSGPNMISLSIATRSSSAKIPNNYNTSSQQMEPTSPYSLPSKSASIGSETMGIHMNMSMAPPSSRNQLQIHQNFSHTPPDLPPPIPMHQTPSDESNLTADLSSYKLIDSKVHLGSNMLYVIYYSFCFSYHVLYIVYLCIIN